MSQDQVDAHHQEELDSAVAQGGAYDVLRKRLTEQGNRLRQIVDGFNRSRLEEFGTSQTTVLGRVRIRTENNCVARDIVQVGDCLLFGYNVFIGLKKEIRIEDVFSLYRLTDSGDGYDTQAVTLEGSFLSDPGFRRDFNELYTYYRDARLLQLLVRDGKLLAGFQVGERVTDIRVFRWSIANSGQEIRYVDNRGERDIAPAALYDFEWTNTTREMMIDGRHSHINILDRVYVQAIGGNLLIKIEDNSEAGLEIYREPVADKTQSLNDLEIAFAQLGLLILLKVRPYKEDSYRYLVFNSLTQAITRIDAIGLACQQLPEDQGIIFPGGIYLQSGDHKTFDQSMEGMQFKRTIRSPNGEDVLYIFYHPDEGRSALFIYNTINRQLQMPIFGHGYARLEDGRMVILSAQSDATRHHPMQIWQTPFFTDDFASRQPPSNSFMGRTGNAELVRGISGLYDLAREIEAPGLSVQRYNQLCVSTSRLLDTFHWLQDGSDWAVAPLLHDIAVTSEAMIDEFEKVEQIRARSIAALHDAQARQKELLAGLANASWTDVRLFVDCLDSLTRQRGHLLTIRDYRFIDLATIDTMERELVSAYDRVAADTAIFLCSSDALTPYRKALEALDEQVLEAETVFALEGPWKALSEMAGDLNLLSALMASLKIEDATQRTLIVELIAEVYARLNQTKARAEQRRLNLGSTESVARFAAQFKLFNQSIAHSLGLSVDAQSCDEQLSRLLVQLDEFESQFAGHDSFLNDILIKREEMIGSFETHRQTLSDARQAQSHGLAATASRIIQGLGQRVERLNSAEQLNAFFAGDPQVIKLRELGVRLRELDDTVKADDIEAQLKAARDQAIRNWRDKADLFDEGGNVIKLGPRHRFSVNVQALDLTLIPRGDELCVHVTGTDLLEPLMSDEVSAFKPYFQSRFESETPDLYRSEYLVGQLLDAAASGVDGMTVQSLNCEPDRLEKVIRDFAAPLYKEGYEKGIHDHDAALIMRQLLSCIEAAGNLRFAPSPRALALLAWHIPGDLKAAMQTWPEKARANSAISRLFNQRDGLPTLQEEVSLVLERYARQNGLTTFSMLTSEAADYLIAVLAVPEPVFEVSKYGQNIVCELTERLVREGYWLDLRHALKSMGSDLGGQWAITLAWVQGLCSEPAFNSWVDYAPEAVALLLLQEADVDSIQVNRRDFQFQVTGLLGLHPSISEGALMLSVDSLFSRLRRHREQFLPGMRRYQTFRQEALSRERSALRLDALSPKPLTSFVRNKLINELYLPLVADNLAKQIGTVGESKRSDLMGLLMLISPPGYGKTTLVEYVASRLGMAFVKINGPSLGRSVTSLDPTQTSNGPSKMELEKLNLAFEMGSNVCLLIDDIQHLSAEFLQKFISLCDGTRRIEGVWKDQSKTYDMRGKKFCVVMAGNPYTESGEAFKVPDMLVNRADIYNLGDVSAGMEDVFALSYIENSLTSNPVLAPLITRDLDDLYRLVDNAQGRTSIATNCIMATVVPRFRK